MQVQIIVRGQPSPSCLLPGVDDLAELLYELLVLLAFPGVVGALDAVLHLLQRLLEHLSEVVVHLVNVLC